VEIILKDKKMGRLRRHMYEEYGQDFNTDERYNKAYRKVKKIKGFYSHLKVYITVNVIIIFLSLNKNFIGSEFRQSGLFEWHTYSTAFSWGIALLIHAFLVFSGDYFFSDNWEEKKIRKYMEEDAANKKKWE